MKATSLNCRMWVMGDRRRISSAFTWQCLGTWFHDEAAGPNDLDLQLSLFVHHSYLNVTCGT